MKQATKAQNKKFVEEVLKILSPLVKMKKLSEQDIYPYYTAEWVNQKGTKFYVTIAAPERTYTHTVFFRSPEPTVHKQNFHAGFHDVVIALDQFKTHFKALDKL